MLDPVGDSVRVWHNGYWAQAPAPGAVWVVPRYEGGRYYVGHWKDKAGKFIEDKREGSSSRTRQRAARRLGATCAMPFKSQAQRRKFSAPAG